MSTKLVFVGAYVVILALIVLKLGYQNGDRLVVTIGLLALVVPVVLFRVRRQIRRVRR